MIGFRLTVVTVLFFASSTRADEVVLRNGSRFTGRATEEGREVRVEVEGGRLRFDRSEVARVERAPIPEELYAARAASSNMDDPVALSGLADYAATLGLKDLSRELAATAAGIELERRVGALDPADAEGFCAAARFAAEKGLGPGVVRHLYARALAADPAQGEARAALLAFERADAAAEEERRALERKRAEDEAAREELLREQEKEEREREALVRARLERERLAAEGQLPPDDGALVAPTYVRHRHVIVEPPCPPCPPRSRCPHPRGAPSCSHGGGRRR